GLHILAFSRIGECEALSRGRLRAIDFKLTPVELLRLGVIAFCPSQIAELDISLLVSAIDLDCLVVLFGGCLKLQPHAISTTKRSAWSGLGWSKLCHRFENPDCILCVIYAQVELADGTQHCRLITAARSDLTRQQNRFRAIAAN